MQESAYRTAPKEKTKGSEAIFSDRQKDNREGFLSTNKSSASLGAKPSAVDAGDNLLRAKESRESAELSAEPEAPMKGTRAQKPFKYMSLLKPKSHAKKPKTISETANSKTALSTAHRQDLGELNSRALDDDKKIDIQAHTAANTATKNLDEVIDESLTTQNTASSTTIPADLWTSRHLPDTPQAKSLPPVASKAGKLNPPSSPNTNNKIESVLNIVADVKSPLPPAPKLNNTSEGENGLHSVVETTTTKSESKPDAERAVAQIAQLMNDGALRNEMDWKIESPAVKAGPEASATNPADLKLAASLQSELSPPDNLDVNMEDSDSSVSGLHQFNKGKGKGKEMEPEAEVAEDSMDLTTEDRIPSISLPIGVSDSPERPLNAEGSSSSAESDGPRNLFASSQLMDIDTDTVELERKPPTSSSLPGLCRSFERFSVSNPTSTTPSPLTPMPTTTSSTSSNPTKKGTSAPTHKPEYAHNLKDDVPQRAPQPTTAMAHGLKKSSEVKPQESRTLTDEICEYHLCTGTIIKFVKCKELHPMANSVSMHAESAPFIWVRISSNGSEGKLVANAASALEGATSSAASKSNLQASTSKVTRPPLTNTYLSANPATQAETLGVVSSGEKSSSTVTSEQKRSDSLLLTSNTASNPAQDQDQAAMKTAQAATGQESEKKDPMTATVSVQTISSVKRDSASQSPQPLPHLTYRGYLPPTDMALLRIAAAVTSSEACPAAGGLPAKPIFKVQGQSFTFHPADLPNISIPMDAPGNISRHVKPPHDLISRTYNPFIPPLLPFSSKSMVSNTSSDVGKLVEPPHRFRPRATSPSPKQKIMTAILEKRRCHSVRKRRILHGKGEGLKRHINVHTTELHLDIDCEIPDPVLRRQAFKPAEPRRDENVVQSQPVPSELRETPQTPIGDLGFTAERRLANDFNDITNSKKHSNNAEAEIRVASEPIVRLTSELAAESASKPSLQSTRKHLVELDSSAPVSNNQTSHHVEKEVELHEEITENGCSLKRKYPTAFPGSSCSLRSDPSNPLGNLFYPHLMADRPFGTDLTPHKTHNWGNNPNTEGSRPHGQMSGNTPGKQTEASKEISDHPGHSFGKGTAGTSGYCTVESPHHLDGGVDLHGDAWDQGNRCRCTACTTNREGIYGLRDAVITHLKTCWPAYLCAALLLPSPSISWML